MKRYYIVLSRYEGLNHFSRPKRLTGNSVKIRENRTIINLNKPTYVSGNRAYYVIDEIKGIQVFLQDSKTNITIEEIDSMVNSRFIKSLTSGMMNRVNFHLSSFLLGLIIGIIGILVTLFYVNDQILNNIEGGGVVLP